MEQTLQADCQQLLGEKQLHKAVSACQGLPEEPDAAPVAHLEKWMPESC